MATFNSRLYVEAAIQSVIRQSFKDFELIVVDDGSTDGGRELIEEYARTDGRIKIIYQEHQGLVYALNRGCHLARGEYIARLDSDDTATPQRFEQQVDYMRQSTVALLGGSIECIDQDGHGMFAINFPSWGQGLRDYLLINCYMAHTTVMFRKDIFMTLGGYRSQFEDAEDHDLFLRMSDHHVVDNLPAVLGNYRIHGDQISSKKASQQIISSIGARLAAWARRANQREPAWLGNTITRDDLISCGIKGERIDALVSRHRHLGIAALRNWEGSI